MFEAAGISVGLLESPLEKQWNDGLVPVVASLLGAVEGRDQASCLPRWGRMSWNGDVNRKFHGSFEVSGLDVNDFVLEVVLCSMRHLISEGLHLADRSVCLEVVDAKALSEALDD